MADILICGIEMPTDEPLRIVLNPNGQLFVDHGLTFTEYEAVELPEHGDLIDRDALFKQMGVTDMDCYKCEFGNHGFCGRGEFSAACEAIEDAPVIVQANNGESE